MNKTVSCPKCGSSIEGGAGFGMVTCASCGEFILMGEVGESVAVTFPVGGGGLGPTPTPPVPGPNVAFEFSFEGEPITDLQLPPIPDENPVRPEIPSSSLPIEVKEKETLPTPISLGQFRDVLDFANDQQESTGTGGLVYDVVIKGIDTVETRREIAACLGDKRLKLNADQILKTIDAGELNLKELNPVKASVLISVIKHLSLKVSWTSRQLIKGALIFLILWNFSAHASDWARHEINLKGYATKIANMQEDIRALLVKKGQNKDPQERDEILKEIIKKNKELNETYAEFKKEKEHVRFEHPEQGDQTERKYKHVKLKSLDELEDEAGLQGQLSRIKGKVEATYPASKVPSEETDDGLAKKVTPKATSRNTSKPTSKPSGQVETDQD